MRAGELTSAVSEAMGKTKAEFLETACDRSVVEEISDMISLRAESLRRRIK